MNIVVADDHPLIRHGVANALARSEHQLLGEAQDSTEALQMVQEHKPDLLILDVQMPGLPVDQTCARAREIHPPLKILIMSGASNETVLRSLVDARINGFLLKDEATDSLLQAIRTIGEGAGWFSHAVSAKILTLGSQPQDELATLTSRERQILALLAVGKTNGEISRELSLSEQTVRNKTSIIYSKLNLRTRSEAVVYAQVRGVVPPTEVQR